jgi:hypothetical protein
MTQHINLTFFEALHASAALSNKLTIISNDEAYDQAEAKRISFKDFLNLLEKNNNQILRRTRCAR